jgi:hypothetical protein
LFIKKNLKSPIFRRPDDRIFNVTLKDQAEKNTDVATDVASPGLLAAERKVRLYKILLH